MKKTSSSSSFQWKLIPIFIAGIILIALLINDLNNPIISNSSQTSLKTVLYIEYALSFVASFVLFFWALSPIFYKLVDFSLSRVTLFYYMYTILLLLASPFALMSIRIFLKDEQYIKNISILIIVSILFSLYFVYNIK